MSPNDILMSFIPVMIGCALFGYTIGYIRASDKWYAKWFNEHQEAAKYRTLWKLHEGEE